MIDLQVNSLELARFLLKQRLKPGDKAVDATAGKGRDTLFLSNLVGTMGRVWAFDIQPAAISATTELLASNGSQQQVKLIQAGHEHLGDYINEHIDAAMFNLGYLPGGDKSIITKPETTVRALEQVIARLTSGGLITLVLYTGHPGGDEETSLVELFVKQLPQGQFAVLKFTYPNRGETTPYLIAIQKR